MGQERDGLHQKGRLTVRLERCGSSDGILVSCLPYIFRYRNPRGLRPLNIFILFCALVIKRHIYTIIFCLLTITTKYYQPTDLVKLVGESQSINSFWSSGSVRSTAVCVWLISFFHDLSCRIWSVSSRLEGHHHVPHPVPALHPGLAGPAGAHPALCAALLLQVWGA